MYSRTLTVADFLLNILKKMNRSRPRRMSIQRERFDVNHIRTSIISCDADFEVENNVVKTKMVAGIQADSEAKTICAVVKCGYSKIPMIPYHI